MQPVQITIRDLPFSPTLEAAIRTKSEKLYRFYDRIMSCKVVVEYVKKNQHQGKLYNVRIDLLVPGKELVATHKTNADIYIAIRDAFQALERQLEEHSKKRHGRVKKHHNVMHGRIKKIVSDQGYGFIEGTDGHEYYFSLTNVSYPEFSQLAVGDAVGYFIGEPLTEGLQANHVVKERHNDHV